MAAPARKAAKPVPIKTADYAAFGCQAHPARDVLPPLSGDVPRPDAHAHRAPDDTLQACFAPLRQLTPAQRTQRTVDRAASVLGDFKRRAAGVGPAELRAAGETVREAAGYALALASNGTTLPLEERAELARAGAAALGVACGLQTALDLGA